GIVGRDDQTTAAVQVPFHEVPLGRVERRVLLQPDLPEDRATSLKHGEVRKPLVGDPPQGMGPAIRGEPRLVRCLQPRRERRTSVVAGWFVLQRTVPLVALRSVTVTSWIVGPLARTLARAVDVCGGPASWYVAVRMSPSRTWRTPSAAGVPKAVWIEPRHTSSGPPPTRVTFSPALSIPDVRWTR